MKRPARDERGFTLLEVLIAVMVLGIVGAAATHLVIRLTTPRETTIRYEQRSLAARMAAEEVWAMFAESPGAPPARCLPWATEPPPAVQFQALDVNYAFAFRCTPFEENGQLSSTLYRVYVWVLRLSDGEVIGEFPMLARLGGY